MNSGFKELLAVPTIEDESILVQLMDLLNLMAKDLAFLNKERLNTLKQLLEVIFFYLQGPIETNIELCIAKDYQKTLQTLLTFDYDENKLMLDSLHDTFIKTKQVMAETILILIPYLPSSQPYLQLVEQQLTKAYVLSRRTYSGSY